MTIMVQLEFNESFAINPEKALVSIEIFPKNRTKRHAPLSAIKYDVGGGKEDSGTLPEGKSRIFLLHKERTGYTLYIAITAKLETPLLATWAK